MSLPRAIALALALGAAAPDLGADDNGAALRRALGFLRSQQVRKPVDIVVEGVRVRDFPGDWPQYFALQGTKGPRVRDVSPFMVAFIHHALALAVEENRAALRLRRRDVAAAREMRTLAVSFLSRFESRADAPDAGTFAFWPYDQDPEVPGPALERRLLDWLGGPLLGGARAPWNLRILPGPMAIPSDADVTATAYAALLDDAEIDSGPGRDTPFHEFFADWRDLGVIPRRKNLYWLPPASGVFLTWLAYREADAPLFPNDVDLVVNANVLFALGRFDRLDTPGTAEAVGLIDRVVAEGLHRDRIQEVAEYYPDNLVFHYAVSRAFREGGVAELARAVGELANELEASAIEGSDSTAHWDRGAPHLNTAFALLTLLNAGRVTPLAERAARYLVREQRCSGGYESAPFFLARADKGQVFEFSSAALTTAMAFEALARYELATREE